jgi:hypothetical protein
VGEDRTSSNRLSVYEAAEVMGVTVDAIRKRVARDTIPHEKGEDGRVWVLLDTDQYSASKVRDTDQPQSANDALTFEIQALREQVEWLRGEVQRKDAILLNMTEAMKALSPPSEAQEMAPERRESPEPASAGSPSTQTPSE